MADNKLRDKFKEELLFAEERGFIKILELRNTLDYLYPRDYITLGRKEAEQEYFNLRVEETAKAKKEGRQQLAEEMMPLLEKLWISGESATEFYSSNLTIEELSDLKDKLKKEVE